MTDAVHVRARRVLLDAMEALGEHRRSLVLVGAQAIYLHTGEGDLAVAPYTTDGDLVIDPAGLLPTPTIAEAMNAAGFVLDAKQPGIWVGADSVSIDLLVPDALGGRGRRGARLGEHGNRVARKALGLEASLVDNALAEITALDEADGRKFQIAVAGPAALLVAKLHKLADRTDAPNRLSDKDALDILRLLRGTETDEIALSLRRLREDQRSSEVTATALVHLRTLFGTSAAPGSRMAARAAGPLEDPDTIAGSVSGLVNDLLDILATDES